MKKPSKNIIIKSLISLLLLGLIFYQIDLGSLFKVLKTINLQIFIFSWVLFLFQQLVIAYSWQILLKAQRNNVPFVRILEIHFIGHFFGTFMPSSIGMDIVRAYGLAKYLRRGVDAASSMFVCRAIGFSVFFVIAIMAAIYLYNLSSDLRILRLVLILFMAYIFALLVFLNSSIRSWLGRFLEKFRISKFKNKIEDMYSSIFDCIKYKKQIILLILLSFFFQILGIIIIWLIGVSLGIKVSLIYYFINIPIIMAITLLPISISGIGVREGAFVYFFVQVGAKSVEALSLSFLLFFQWIALAIMGGLLYLFTGFSFKKNCQRTSYHNV